MSGQRFIAQPPGRPAVSIAHGAPLPRTAALPAPVLIPRIFHPRVGEPAVVQQIPGAQPRIMMPRGDTPPDWPAAPPPLRALGNTGEVYGIQSRQQWAAGDTTRKQIIDVVKSEFVWRLSVFGAVLVTIDYGTKADRHLLNLLAPCVITVPGQIVVSAVPTTDDGAICTATLTKATGGAHSEARNLVDATVTAAPFSDDAVRFVALLASTATIAGQAVTIAALETVPLVAGSVLLTGSGFQEFEA